MNPNPIYRCNHCSGHFLELYRAERCHGSYHEWYCCYECGKLYYDYNSALACCPEAAEDERDISISHRVLAL